MTIKNADMPAMPVFDAAGIVQDSWSGFLSGNGMGLTKREIFAMTAMQGILSNPSLLDNLSDSTVSWVKEKSIILSNELLDGLDKESANDD